MANLSKPEVGGLMLIRTGRLALYRDLNLQPLIGGLEANHVLEDYAMSNLFGENASPRVEGTLISLILPARSVGSA
jgi:hypothetical protein